MNNPWENLPTTFSSLSTEQNFILDCDKQFITEFNEKYSNQIQTNIQPEPFAGRVDSPVVILMSMPEFTPELDHVIFRNQQFAEDLHSVREQNIKQPTTIAYPFYHLNPTYNTLLKNNGPNPGYQYWEPKMRSLIQQRGANTIASNILALQAFPYKTSPGKNVVLLARHQRALTKQHGASSFSYTRHLFHEALKRNALIVLLSGKTFWEGEMTHFGTFNKHNIVHKKNPSCLHLSPRNLKYNGFDRILERISRSS